MEKRHADRIGDAFFRGMAAWFRIADLFFPKKDRLAAFGIREGETVVDYGCGPGRYIEEASRRVGPAGKVYAVDIHELAIPRVEERIREAGLRNVVPVLARGYSCAVPDGAADRIWALDMFHMISDPAAFLAELRRIAGPGAVLILEDGHQFRKKTLRKLSSFPGWRIEREEKSHVVCTAA